jgi:pyruvate kinase
MGTTQTSHRPPRGRHVRVLATLGPASGTPEMVRKLYEAGADAFRVNMSHGDDASRVGLIEMVRAMEK